MVCDVPKLKIKSGREKLTYGSIMLVSVYLSIDYVAEANWPNLNDVINFFFLEFAKGFVESVKMPS
jgi:hypothetical protein